jgi:hypothetical protein
VSKPCGRLPIQSQIPATRKVLFELAVVGVGPRETHVVADARREEVNVLRCHADGPADVLLPVLAHVPTGDRHPPALRVEKPQ